MVYFLSDVDQCITMSFVLNFASNPYIPDKLLKSNVLQSGPVVQGRKETGSCSQKYPKPEQIWQMKHYTLLISNKYRGRGQ